MSNTNETQQPIFRKQLRGGIAAAVFENEYKGRFYPSVNLQRSYFKNKDWHRSNIVLNHEDIPFAIAALELLWDYLNNDYVAKTTDDLAA